MSQENHKAGKKTPTGRVDIGAVLVSQRKSKNISVAVVAKTTNLSREIIEHLENNAFSDIGAAVYVRGYLGLYAKFLGLDVADVLRLYNTQYPSEDATLRPAITQLGGGMAKQQKKRHSKALSLLVSLVFLLCLLFIYFRIEPLLFQPTVENEQQGIAQPVDGEELVTEEPLSVIVDESEEAKNLADDVLKGQPIVGNNTSANDEVLSPIQLESVLNDVSDVSDIGVNAAEDNEGSGQQAALKITFRDDCWLSVTDASGKKLVEGTYSPKRSLSVEGKLPLMINTARVSAIKAATLDKKTIKISDYRFSERHYEIK
ncbi:MAG: hypothetical protein CR975_05135 [Gammaproteobacteria bacterium]|nr:MAG: hypothetical protein CR975_05135 [Gammaproteobacteria bacterium]